MWLVNNKRKTHKNDFCFYCSILLLPYSLLKKCFIYLFLYSKNNIWKITKQKTHVIVNKTKTISQMWSKTHKTILKPWSKTYKRYGKTWSKNTQTIRKRELWQYCTPDTLLYELANLSLWSVQCRHGLGTHKRICSRNHM